MNVISRIFTTRVAAIAVFVVTTVAALGIWAAPSSAGPIGFQATGGWYSEEKDYFLGAGARFGLGTITVIPNGEWLFVDSGSMYTLNLDATLSVLPLGVANGYVGAGVGMLTVDPENADRNTDSVVNLIAGAGLNALPLKPFGQFKWVMVTGNDPVVFSLGIRF